MNKIYVCWVEKYSAEERWTYHLTTDGEKTLCNVEVSHAAYFPVGVNYRCKECIKHATRLCDKDTLDWVVFGDLGIGIFIRDDNGLYGKPSYKNITKGWLGG